MLYGARFAMALLLASLASNLVANCEEEETKSVWNDEEERCVPYFEYLCLKQKQRSNISKQISINTLLYYADTEDCMLASDFLVKRTSLEIHNPDFRTLTPLNGFRKLKLLNLSRTSVDDESLLALESLPNLEVLNLTNTLVEDVQTLIHLKATHPQLRTILMINAPIAFIRETYLMQKDLPTLKVIF